MIFRQIFGRFPEGVDAPDERSRNSEIGRVINKAKAKNSAAADIAKGLPPDFHSRPMSYADRKRIIDGARLKRFRAKRAAKSPTPVAATLPPAKITGDWIEQRFTQLKKWIASNADDPMAKQIRGRESEFVKVAAAFHGLINTLGRKPTRPEFAAKLREIGIMTPDTTDRGAQNRIDRLRKLEAVGGPWG